MSSSTFASLGISVTTSGVSQATQELKSLAEQAKITETAISEMAATLKARLQAEQLAVARNVKQELVDLLATISQKVTAEAEGQSKIVKQAEEASAKKIKLENETADKLIEIKTKISTREAELNAQSIQLMREHNAKRIVEEEVVNAKLLELEAKKRAGSLGGLGGGGGTGTASQPMQAGALSGLGGTTKWVSPTEQASAAEEAYQKYIKAVIEMDAYHTRASKEEAEHRAFYIESTLNARKIVYQNNFQSLLAIEEDYYKKVHAQELEEAKKHEEIRAQQKAYDEFNDKAYTNSKIVMYSAMFDEIAAKEQAAAERSIAATNYLANAKKMAAEQVAADKLAEKERAAMQKASDEAIATEQRLAAERRSVIANSYRQDTQVVVTELNQRIELESAIRRHGFDSNKVIALRASQDEVNIRRAMNEEIIAIEERLRSGLIANRTAADEYTSAIIRRTEAQLSSNRAVRDGAIEAENSAKHHNTLHNVMNRLVGITAAMGAYQVFGFLIGIPKQIFDTNVEMERLNVLLEGVTGSAEKAHIEFKKLERLDLKTPFDIEGLTKTFVMLTNYGLQPTDAVMKSLTDQVAKLGGGTEQLIGIGRQLGQAWAKDKLQMVDMRPMIENGLPVISLLGEAINKTASEILEMSRKGEITREIMMKLFDQMEKNAPDASARAMNTLAGSISNVKTSMEQLQNAILEDKSEGWIKRFLNNFTEYTLILKDFVSNEANPAREMAKISKEMQDIQNGISFRNDIAKTRPLSKGELETQEREKQLLMEKMEAYKALNVQINEQTKKEEDLNKEKESKLAKDQEALAVATKNQAISNASIDSQIKDQQRLITTKLANFELERKQNDDLYSRNAISANQRYEVEIDLIHKIRDAKVQALMEEERLQKSKIATGADADKIEVNAIKQADVAKKIADDRAKVIAESQVAEQKAYSEKIKSSYDYQKALDYELLKIKQITGSSKEARDMEFELSKKYNVDYQKTISTGDKEGQAIYEQSFAAQQAKPKFDLFKENKDIIESEKAVTSFNAQLDKTRKLFDEGIISEGEFKDQMTKLSEAYNKEFIDPAETSTKRMSEFAKQAARNMESSFANFLYDPFKNGLKGMLAGFTDMLRKMAAEAAAASIMDQLLGPKGSNSWGLLGKLFDAGLNFTGSATVGAAKNIATGNTFSGNGPLLTYGNANGGVYSGAGISAYSSSVVSSPTLFPFASGIGLMGEAGPEAIMPLKRNASGALGVQVEGSTKSGNVTNITVNVQSAKGDSAEETGNKVSEVLIRNLIKQEIITANRPGNQLNKYTKIGA